MSDGEILIEIEGAERSEDRRAIEASEKKTAEYQAEAEHYRSRRLAAEAELARRQYGAAVQSVEQTEQSAQWEYARAMERADFDAAARAQTQLSEAAARKVQLEQHRDQFERQAAGDPFDRYVAQFTDPTQRWMRNHKDWITDPEKNAKLQKAHHHAVGEGHKVDSDEYFEHVEKRIGLHGESNRRGSIVKNKTLPEGVNSGNPNTHKLGPNRVFLTPGECRTATDGTLVWSHGPKKGQPLGLEEFSRRKLRLLAAGAYNRLD
jgi:hypothetical protein